MGWFRRTAAALFSAFSLAAAAQAGDLHEERLLLPVTIAGQPYHLDALIVRPAGPGRFPVALLANGSSGTKSAADFRPDWLGAWARDFAHRGWLAASILWRGYGRSDGAIQSQAGTCDVPDSRRFLEDHADDLAAALTALARRTDVDRGQALGVGLSIGGASMLALAARPDHPLTAVINASGGLYRNAKPFQPDPRCAPFEADLVRSFGSFGQAFAGPTLWLYAENDPWFRPDWVERLRAAYTAAGGAVEFVGFPPFGDDGHQLFLQYAGKRQVIPHIDAFLRHHQLPTLDEARVSAILTRFDASQDGTVLDYLRSVPSEKALAAPTQGKGLYWSSRTSLDEARTGALDYCHRQSGQACHLVLEDFDQPSIDAHRADN